MAAAGLASVTCSMRKMQRRESRRLRAGKLLQRSRSWTLRRTGWWREVLVRQSGEETVWSRLAAIYAQGSWRGGSQTAQGKPRRSGRGGASTSNAGVWVSGAVIYRPCRGYRGCGRGRGNFLVKEIHSLPPWNFTCIWHLFSLLTTNMRSLEKVYLFLVLYT